MVHNLLDCNKLYPSYHMDHYSLYQQWGIDSDFSVNKCLTCYQIEIHICYIELLLKKYILLEYKHYYSKRNQSMHFHILGSGSHNLYLPRMTWAILIGLVSYKLYLLKVYKV